MDLICYLIVGLGNPGLKYAANRHNVGFRCLDRVAAALELSFDKQQKQARVALGSLGDRRVILAQPQTYMNDSGRAVAPLARFYKVPTARLLVVYDDLDLPLGALRIRPEGGSGGHRGMRSIIEQLGGQDFARIRIGIGRPPGRMDPAAYVLRDFCSEETPFLDEVLARAAAAVDTWVTDGVEAAMNRYNGEVHPPEA